uniref:lasso peptide biosynthesis B2 protein n=1 Tax=Streptomyces sp. YIM 98790 TaxID=2689077 RepID=UPI00140E3BB5
GPAAPGGPLPLRRRDRLAGLGGFLLALCLLRLPFRVTVRGVTVARRLLCRSPATPAQAERALRTVRRAARRHPGRAACLELSLGAVLALALTGRSAAWCLGGTGDALRFHAWIEAGRVPVHHPDDGTGAPGNGPLHTVLTL